MSQESKPRIQIDDLVREMTAIEYEAYQAEVISAQAKESEEQAKKAARQSALAKLSALGLTEAEIAAL
jgi:DNA-binding NarL/FixJ family response regulator